jgi:acyl transferase domain-containing protein
LKPLEDAIRDNDCIRAVIRNTGINQDGKTNGITLPSSHAQAELIRKTYLAAGLDPLCTTYVEAHGTGTQAGDPLEAAALSKIFCADRTEPLAVGSVKTNIGHLEGASGVAGLVKTVLMLEKGEILPNAHFKEPNDRIPLDEWKLDVCTSWVNTVYLTNKLIYNTKVPTSLRKWKGNIHRASINSFG